MAAAKYAASIVAITAASAATAAASSPAASSGCRSSRTASTDVVDATESTGSTGPRATRNGNADAARNRWIDGATWNPADDYATSTRHIKRRIDAGKLFSFSPKQGNIFQLFVQITAMGRSANDGASAATVPVGQRAATVHTTATGNCASATTRSAAQRTRNARWTVGSAAAATTKLNQSELHCARASPI